MGMQIRVGFNNRNFPLSARLFMSSDLHRTFILKHGYSRLLTRFRLKWRHKRRDSLWIYC